MSRKFNFNTEKWKIDLKNVPHTHKFYNKYNTRVLCTTALHKKTVVCVLWSEYNFLASRLKRTKQWKGLYRRAVYVNVRAYNTAHHNQMENRKI